MATAALIVGILAFLLGIFVLWAVLCLVSRIESLEQRQRAKE